MNQEINTVFMGLSRRAERNDRATLLETFVDVGPLFRLLSSIDHQVIFGRRGTGKTHALSYLAEKLAGQGEPVALVDLRTAGSSGGMYSDQSLPISERATRLLSDALAAIHEELYHFFDQNRATYDFSQIGPLLDDLAEDLTNVRVVGTSEQEQTRSSSIGIENSSSSSVNLSIAANPNIELGAENHELKNSSSKSEDRMRHSGTLQHSVHFGGTTKTLEAMSSLAKPKRIWILLDEWSSVPLELQPYLADFLRRSLMAVRGIVVKLAAIELRSLFLISGTGGGYVGIELGADIAADVNLDDFMVYDDNNSTKATTFFRDLVYRHYKSIMEDEQRKDVIPNKEELIAAAFTQVNVFEEFVRAAEGVPRDAINILILAAQSAQDNKISMQNIRAAAKTWYQRDKETAVRANSSAMALLVWIIDKVIGRRQARGFMLQSTVRAPLIDDLFDARVLHLLKRNVSAHDEPGVRYDAYKLDYGCYVDLINTSRNPKVLFRLDEDEEDNGAADIEVPQDDYRSLRRAILDLQEFYERPPRLLPEY